MKKFVRGMWMAVGCFLALGIVLGVIGVVSARYVDEKYVREGVCSVGDIWRAVRKWDLRFVRGGWHRGLIVTYDNIKFDKDYDIAYGSFTDDGLRGEKIRNLDLEIDGGELTLQKGSGMSLIKDGGPECQYYIEGDTFYLRQKCLSPIGSDGAHLTLTLPEDIALDKVRIKMGAGAVMAEGFLAAREVEVELGAGEVTMEEVKADSFSADVAAGSVEVRKLDATECDTNVSMGEIVLENALVTGDLDAAVSMGDISIYLRDSYEDHAYEVNCGMGEVEIVTEKRETKGFSGIGGSTTLVGANAASGSVYDLSCSMGDIYMEFLGVEKEKFGGE